MELDDAIFGHGSQQVRQNLAAIEISQRRRDQLDIRRRCFTQYSQIRPTIIQQFLNPLEQRTKRHDIPRPVKQHKLGRGIPDHVYRRPHLPDRIG